MATCLMHYYDVLNMEEIYIYISAFDKWRNGRKLKKMPIFRIVYQVWESGNKHTGTIIDYLKHMDILIFRNLWGFTQHNCIPL